MKYAFFPGCVLEGAAKEDFIATVAVAKNQAFKSKNWKVGLAAVRPTFRTLIHWQFFLPMLVTLPQLKHKAFS